MDTELSAKLEQELSLEKESKDAEELPEALQDFVENSGFEVGEFGGVVSTAITDRWLVGQRYTWSGRSHLDSEVWV